MWTSVAYLGALNGASAVAIQVTLLHAQHVAIICLDMAVGFEFSLLVQGPCAVAGQSQSVSQSICQLAIQGITHSFHQQ